jgi:predicted RNase H-like HicB family nuclease
MIFDIVLKKSEEGWAVWCPALKGCASQGATKAAAIRNIRSAIAEFHVRARKLARKSRGQVRRLRIAA